MHMIQEIKRFEQKEMKRINGNQLSHVSRNFRQQDKIIEETKEEDSPLKNDVLKVIDDDDCDLNDESEELHSKIKIRYAPPLYGGGSFR